jgi:ribonuclease BN (tRNA processing enzyme)
MDQQGLAVTVLGCDGSYPGPGGACSGYLVSCNGTRVWMDAGGGTLAYLQTLVPIEEIDAVVISHQHPDHWTDLEHLATACKWVVHHSGIPVYATPEVPSLMRVGAAAEVLDWCTVGDGDTVRVGSLTLSFSQTDHISVTLAVRVDGEGRSLGYSADTGPGWQMSALGPGLDLALCEATFLADHEGTIPHLSARQAGHTARDAGVGRLVLTHLWPRIDREVARAEGTAAFGSDVELAAIGERYEA